VRAKTSFAPTVQSEGRSVKGRKGERKSGFLTELMDIPRRTDIL
jgi:hypothetical protein